MLDNVYPAQYRVVSGYRRLDSAMVLEVARCVITHHIVDSAETPLQSSSPPLLSILNPGQIFPLRRPLITRTCVGGLTANLFAGNGAEGGAGPPLFCVLEQVEWPEIALIL